MCDDRAAAEIRGLGRGDGRRSVDPRPVRRAVRRHVVDTVRGAGAGNVWWAFNPTADTYPRTTPVEAVYPGHGYVDVLALDGYNWGDGQGLTWRSFRDIVGEQYARLTALAPGPWRACGRGSPDTLAADNRIH